MKIELKKIVETLEKVNKTTKSDKDAPLLKGVLFTQKGEWLLGTSTNGINTTISTVPCQEGSGETFLMEGKIALEVWRKLKGEFIELTIEDQKLKYTVGDFTGSFDLMDAGEYPTVGKIEGIQLAVPADKLSNLIHYTHFSVLQGAVERPILGCVHVEIVPNEDGSSTLKGTSTDGNRLSHIAIPLVTELKEELKFNIPVDFLRVVNPYLGEGQIGVMANNKEFAVSIGTDIYITRLIEGAYIPYDKMLMATKPAKDGETPEPPFTATIGVNREQLLNKFEALSSIKKDSKSLIRLNLEDQKLSLFTVNEKANLNAVAQVAHEGVNIDKIGFDCQYVQEVLKAIGSENVYMHFKNGTSPAYVRPVDNTLNYIHMILPVSI